MPESNALVFIAKTLTPYRSHFLARLASRLPEFAITVILTGGPPNQPWARSSPAGVRVIDIPRPRPGSFRQLASIWSALRFGRRVLSVLDPIQPATVIVHGYDDPAHVSVIRHCARTGTPVVLRADSNIHGEDQKPFFLRLAKRWALRFVFRYIDAFMPVGTNGFDYFLHYGVLANRVFIVPLEADYPLFSRHVDTAALRSFQATFRIRPTRKSVLFVGRLAAEKRVDVLIRAFSVIAATREDWNLLISGDGPQMATLHQSVPAIFRDRVVWTGFLEPDELRLAYASSRVLVLPSEAEQWGLVVNEAIAAGLATIVSDAVGAARDLVPYPDAGWVFPTNDHGALASMLLEATEGDEASRKNEVAREVLITFRQENDSAEQIRLMLRFLAT